MKALKLGLTAVLLTLMAFSYAANDPQSKFEKSGYIMISLDDAKASRSFALDIYNQVEMSFLLTGGNQNKLIYAKVTHGNGVYLVFGKYREWKAFFYLSGGGKLGPPTKRSELIRRTE